MICWTFVQTYRKSGIPAATDTPAPVNTMIFLAFPDWIQSARFRMSRSVLPSCRSASSKFKFSSGFRSPSMSFTNLEMSFPILLLVLFVIENVKFLLHLRKNDDNSNDAAQFRAMPSSLGHVLCLVELIISSAVVWSNVSFEVLQKLS